MTFERYVIGNKEKNKFLGFDKKEERLTIIDNFCSDELEIFPETEANIILETNKYTRFYLINDMKYKYKIVGYLE
jgi:hypothetical protein